MSTAKHYSKEEIAKLKHIKSLPSNQRTQAIIDFARNYSRAIPGVTQKLYTLKTRNTKIKQINVEKIDNNNNQIILTIKSFKIINNKLIINY